MPASRFGLQLAGARVLRTAARAVRPDEYRELTPLLDAMKRTAKHENAQGLCAPQLGESLRLFMLAADAQGGEPPLVAINPHILRRSRSREIGWEACLSVPDYAALVSRPSRISVSYETLEGEHVREQILTGNRARVFQHEVDHLDGVLFTSRMILMSMTHTSLLDNVRTRMQIESEAARLEDGG